MHESGSLRISDFGTAMQFDLESGEDGPGGKRGMVSSTAGSMAFWPPEAVGNSSEEGGMGGMADINEDFGPEKDVMESKKYSAFGADIWAVGVILHCFLFGSLPFSIESGDPTKLFEDIARFDSFDVSNYLPVVVDKLHSRSDSLNDIWKRMMLTDPQTRMTLDEALSCEVMISELRKRDEKEGLMTNVSNS